MAAKDVVIKISATDAASPTFKRIASEAKSMGASVDSSAKQASTSLDKVKTSGAAVGAAMGAIVGGVSLAGQAFVSQEQQIRGLNRAYGESSESIQKFAKELQQTTTYSDDAARQSAQIAATLTRSYGLTADQIELLISTTADLASVNLTAEGRQFTLADAVQRTASAIRGEAESAEALGLTLSDSAVAAAAAERGLTGWTTTMTEAEKAQFRFTLLLEQSAYAHGAAAEAADTNAGKAKQFINSLQDQVQGFGEATGAAGEYLSVMGDMALALPLVTGLLGKLGAGLGALGLTGGAAGLAAIAALGGIEAYRTLNGQGLAATGTSPELTAWNAFFGGASDVANWALPGNPFNSDQYSTAQDANKVEDVLKSLFFIDPVATGTQDKDYAKALYERLITFGVIPQSQYTDSQTGRDEQLDQISSRAASSGLTLEQFIMSYLTAPNSTAVYDPVSKRWMDKGELQIYTGQRTQLRSDQIAAGANVYNGSPGTSGLENAYLPPVQYLGLQERVTYLEKHQAQSMATMGAESVAMAPANAFAASDFANSGSSMALMGSQSVAIAENATRALEAQYGAYMGLVTGINSANDATAAFKATQDGLSGEMDVYQQQASEWNSQLSAQEAAYKILEQRQIDGIELTKEQTDFMNEYAHATEVGTAAVEDSTVSAGILAQQLLLNKETGDAMNATLNGTNEVLGTLAEALTAYILTLEGVPEEVRTELILNSDPALESLYGFLGLIPSSVTIPMYVSGTDINNFLGGGSNGMTVNAYAGGGTMYGGGHALVGERGPELVWLPNGAQVTNTEATKSRMNKGKRGGGDIYNYGPITLQPNTSDVYGALSSQLMGGVR